jgi:hypothetical protein
MLDLRRRQFITLLRSAAAAPEYWIDGRRIRAAGKAPSRIPSAVR